MALAVLGFLSIMVTTFVVVVVMTRPSDNERLMNQRMALIRPSPTTKAGVTPEAEQLMKATIVGRFTWLEKILQDYGFARKVQKRILQANSPTTVGTLILGSVALFLAGYAVTWLFASMVLVDLLAGIALSLLPWGLLAFQRTRRINAFNAALAESIDMLARALRAGHSVVGALGMLAENAQEPAATEFGEVFKQQNLGLPLRDAMLQLLDRVPSADLRVLVTAILVQKDTGGNLAEILDRTVFVIRERLRIQGEIQTQTAQGRMTGWILSLLPIGMMLLLNVVNPGYSSILFSDPLGRKLIYFSLGMLVVGAFIIRQIVNGIEV
jgi:tight adherence protein B